MEKRIVAFDIGDKRIGVAVSDPFNEYAMPCDTYFRTGDTAADAAALLAFAKEEGAGTIVCGLPVNADGTAGVQTQKTERFLRALKEASDIPVLTEDERYTTLSARQDLNFLGVSAKKDKRKKTVDSLAAAYILESYLSKLKKENADMSYKEESNDYEDDSNIVELVDEEGKTERYEHVGTIEYKGEWYCFFTPEKTAEENDEEYDGDEVIALHVVGEEDDEHLETIEDDALLDEVFAEFCNQYEEYEDADEAAMLEPDEE